MTLNQVPVRQWRRIAAHSAHHPRLLELGFMPLENVRVLQRSWFKNGALVVQVGDAVVVKDYLATRQLAVERLFVGAPKIANSDATWKPRAELSVSQR